MYIYPICFCMIIITWMNMLYTCKSYVHNYIHFSVYIRSVYKGYHFWQLFRLNLQGWLAGRRGAVVAPDTATPWAGECWTTRGLSEGFWCFEKQKDLGKFRLLKNVGFRRYYFSLCSLKVVWHPKKNQSLQRCTAFQDLQKAAPSRIYHFANLSHKTPLAGCLEIPLGHFWGTYHSFYNWSKVRGTGVAFCWRTLMGQRVINDN